MKTSDFIAKFLADAGIDTAFVLTGGCIVHVIDSIANTDGIDYVPVQHGAGQWQPTTESGAPLVNTGQWTGNELNGVCFHFDSFQ